jgi:amino acid permease
VSSKRFTFTFTLLAIICYLNKTRVTTARFWRRSAISSFHLVALHSPIFFFSFLFHILLPAFFHFSI